MKELPTQSPGAGPSQPRLSPTLAPNLPLHEDPNPKELAVQVQPPSRAGTLHSDVELGVFLQPDHLPVGPGSAPLSPPGDGIFSRRGSAGSTVVSKAANVGKSFFLADSIWRTDIITFCCHTRLDSVLGSARITHVQARKSRRPPFLHEYILVFFTAARGQRFVLRIDRLGKVASTSAGWRQDIALNTAIQEVGVYHIQDSQSGIDSPDGAWLAMDGRWGSHAIATLATWEVENERGGHVSHHLQTAAMHGGLGPELKDVSKLLEAILLEMPNYHLTTTNCYFMTRSSLLLLQRCYPSAFACHLGSMSGELMPGSDLAEPVWAGLIKWYLPVVVIFFMLYIPPVVFIHTFLATSVNCGDPLSCAGAFAPSKAFYAFRMALHAIFDGPLPIGLMHGYMTSLEEEMNELVVRLLMQLSVTQSADHGNPSVPMKPFSTLIDGSWLTLVAWCALGGAGALFLFIILLFTHGLTIMFFIILVIGVWFNFKFSGNEREQTMGVDDTLAPY